MSPNHNCSKLQQLFTKYEETLGLIYYSCTYMHKTFVQTFSIRNHDSSSKVQYIYSIVYLCQIVIFFNNNYEWQEIKLQQSDPTKTPYLF